MYKTISLGRITFLRQNGYNNKKYMKWMTINNDKNNNTKNYYNAYSNNNNGSITMTKKQNNDYNTENKDTFQGFYNESIL